MSRMIASFQSLFKPGHNLARERMSALDSEIDAIAASVAGRFARGSIPLQTDRALSESRLNDERNALAGKRKPARR